MHSSHLIASSKVSYNYYKSKGERQALGWSLVVWFETSSTPFTRKFLKTIFYRETRTMTILFIYSFHSYCMYLHGWCGCSFSSLSLKKEKQVQSINTFNLIFNLICTLLFKFCFKIQHPFEVFPFYIFNLDNILRLSENNLRS